MKTFKNFISSLPRISKNFNPRKNLPEAVLIIKTYNRDVVISFKYPSYNPLNKNYGSCRGDIKDFSLRSMRRLKLVARNIAPKMKATIDLTYPKDFPVDGKTVKNHYSKFRKRLRRLGINSLWVLEFQKRGAPHFHLMVDGEVDKALVSKMWFEIVGSGDEKHLHAGTRVQAIKDEGRVIRYISSYMKKLTQKIVPEEFKNVGRFWGYSFSLLEVTEKIIQGSSYELKKGIRTLRRWYKSKLRSWGINWRWKGNGFIAWEGAKPIILLQI